MNTIAPSSMDDVGVGQPNNPTPVETENTTLVERLGIDGALKQIIDELAKKNLGVPRNMILAGLG